MKNLILSRNKWPSLPVAERASASDSKLYAWGSVPTMDARDEDYVFEVCIHTADPDAERQLAEHVSRCVNSAAMTIDAMEFALQKLDSVAFLSEEGDTNVAKQSLIAAIAALRGEEKRRTRTAEFT